VAEQSFSAGSLTAARRGQKPQDKAKGAKLMDLNAVLSILKEFEENVPVFLARQGNVVVPEPPREVQRVLESAYGKKPDDLVPSPCGSQLRYRLVQPAHSLDWLREHAKAVVEVALRYQPMYVSSYHGELSVSPPTRIHMDVRDLLGGEEPEWIVYYRWLRLRPDQLQRVVQNL
jgi:hypothetical protein